jgi:hypothetical protein
MKKNINTIFKYTGLLTYFLISASTSFAGGTPPPTGGSTSGPTGATGATGLPIALIDANPELKKCLPDPTLPLATVPANMCKETTVVTTAQMDTTWTDHLFDAASTTTNPRELTGRYDTKGRRCGGLPADSNCPIELRAKFEIRCPDPTTNPTTIMSGGVRYCPRLESIKVFHGTRQVFASPGVPNLPTITNANTAGTVNYNLMRAQDDMTAYCRDQTEVTLPPPSGATITYASATAAQKAQYFPEYTLYIPTGMNDDGTVRCGVNPMKDTYAALQAKTRCGCAASLEVGESCLALYPSNGTALDTTCNATTAADAAIKITNPLCKCEGNKPPEYLIGSGAAANLRKNTVKTCINAGGQPVPVLPVSATSPYKICKFSASTDLAANLDSIRKNDPNRVELNRPRVQAYQHVKYLLSKACPATWIPYENYSSTTNKNCSGDYNDNDQTGQHPFMNKLPEVACCLSRQTYHTCDAYLSTGCINGPSGFPQINGSGNTNEGGLHAGNIDPNLRRDIYLTLGNYTEFDTKNDDWCSVSGCAGDIEECHWTDSYYNHNQVAQINEVGCK